MIAAHQLQQREKWCDHLVQLHKKTIIGIVYALAWICTCKRGDNTYFDMLTQAQSLVPAPLTDDNPWIGQQVAETLA